MWVSAFPRRDRAEIDEGWNLSATRGVKRQRRTRAEGVDFREHLVTAARDLFVSEGIQSVSIRRIAERAGCSPMTFYVYFKNKRALLYHIWADVIADVRTACARTIDPALPPSERLRTYMLAVVAYWLEHPDSYRITYLTQDFVEADDERFFSADLEEGGRLLELEALIEAGAAEGVFRSLDVVEISHVLYSAAIGLAHLLIMVPEHSWRRDTMVATTFDLLLRGLEKAPAALDP